MKIKRFEAYFATLGRLPLETVATALNGEEIPLETFFEDMISLVREAHARGNELLFIGNGGSAAIASHMAIDYTKNGGMRALAFNDGAALTCLGNDLGYENVFAGQIDMHGRAGDVLIAVSSSGNSANILAGVAAARRRGCDVVTFSGFGADNRLRRLGDYNVYVPSREYGFVEVTHLALIHAVLDLAMGWGAEGEPPAEAALLRVSA